MRMRPVRQFTLFDATVLIAATAVGLAWIRGYVLMTTWPEFIRSSEGWTAWRTLGALAQALHLSQFFLAAWSLAVLVLGLRRPRPPLRRLVFQPGTVVCIAAVFGMANGGLQLLVETVSIRLITGANLWAADPSSQEPLFRSASLMAAHLIGNYCICVSSKTALPTIFAWTLLAWGRKCRPEPSWVDRAGRILGVLWVAAALGDWYLGDLMIGIYSSAILPLSPLPIPSLPPPGLPR